jgi:glycosidase
MKSIFLSCPSLYFPCSWVRLYEFHINHRARLKYRVDDALFESTGNIVFPNFRAVRELAYSINKHRGVLNNPEKHVRAGSLNAFGLLDEINHFLVRVYDEVENPGVLRRAYHYLEATIGKDELERTLTVFLAEFPPTKVYKKAETLENYFSGSTSGRLHKELALEELIMLYLANINPACVPLKELFDDSVVANTSQYYAIFSELDNFFSREKYFGPDHLPLIEALKSPIYTHPTNLEAQLGYFKKRWGIVLSSKFLDRIDSSFEFSKEEEKYFWHLLNPAGGMTDVETFVPEYKKSQLSPEQFREMMRRGLVKPGDDIYEEPERFTPDIEWMPNVILIAKNTYVWLDQLSKKYHRSIKRLDEIPDEELEQLAQWHFTGLWLIGVWERSIASKKIKQINGNLDAVSSAYSLYEYEIAYELGGEEAFRNLSHRAWQRGIRLAGDMVPNHMGIYSKWVIEHPEYFIQTERSPYPNYRFTGVNLSEDPNIELRIEDGYWSRTDAAVVFQRIDKRSGDVRYFYHGNDGTHMPWNDTAQLNLLRADVREAIMQNIFHVARKFSIIRFDAAMTLAKKHFQRLWYPMPGTSGVPSRQDYSMTREEFDEQFPKEFWREVVDRFSTEMPHTLLLAEAFWLMEGYFVRTLGMHRVYNSAFMHMLMKEENEKYRSLIKNTLAFNPEILKRYVNFMSNPDERTAIEQFGKDDKYFGVAVMMVTLPGLPMVAHGQIEGYYEKYGMEYQRSYYNEQPDEWLVRRHEREIFPLMQKRYLFSQVQHFEFYDFIDDRGSVNENVFAYSNRAGNERALIFYHNAYAECSGHIKYSLKKVLSEGGKLRSVSLADALNLQNNEKIFYRFRERRSHLEYLVSGKEFFNHGWRIELKAYQYAVFTDFAELYDATGDLSEIARQLNRRGTENLDYLMDLIRLRPFYSALKELVLHANVKSRKRLTEKFSNVISMLARYLTVTVDDKDFINGFESFYDVVELYFIDSDHASPVHALDTVTRKVVLLYHTLSVCKNIFESVHGKNLSHDIVEQLRLQQVLHEIFDEGTQTSQNYILLISHLLRLHEMCIIQQVPAQLLIEHFMNDFAVADFLGVNQHEDEWYYNKEQFELLITWTVTLQFLYAQMGVKTANPFQQEKKRVRSTLLSILEMSNHSGYKVEKLKELSTSDTFLYSRYQALNKKKLIQKGNRRTSKITKGTKHKTTSSKGKKVIKRKH